MTVKQALAFLLLLAGMAHPMCSQSPEQTGLILKRLDDLERQNAQLLLEIKALRATVAQQVETAAEHQDVNEHRIEELSQTKVEASQRFPIQLTGTVLFNAFTNGVNSGGDQDPTYASLIEGPRNSGGTLRQTVLGFKFNGPQTFLGGKVSGSLFMDFFGGSSFSLNHLLRLRVATVQIAWANTTFAVGQDKPLVSRREPNSLAQVGVSPLTDAGNPWLWQPQARVEQRFSLAGQTELRAEAGIFQTAETNSEATIGVTAPTRIEPSRPSFETRISLKRSWGENRSIEIAPVFHISTSHVNGVSLPSRLYGFDWQIKPASKFEVSGLLFKGRNFGNLGALGSFNINPQGTVIPVRGSGGWLQLRYLATQKLSFDLYGGQQDPRNDDLQSGQIGKNQYYAGNAMYLLAPNVIAAFEFGQNRTTYLGQGNRLNNHYDLALGYLF